MLCGRVGIKTMEESLPGKNYRMERGSYGTRLRIGEMHST